MQTIEQIVEDSISRTVILGKSLDPFDQMFMPQRYKQTLDKLQQLRENTILQTEQFIKENNQNV